MTITYSGTIALLQTAAQRANELLADPAFYNAIAQKSGFDGSTATGAQVAASMQKCTLTLTVKTFKRIFTRELGYEDPNDPTSIYINVTGNKLDRSLGSIVGTFIHEAVHAADADDEQLDFPHNGNGAFGNENTAPYWIGNLAVQMVDSPADAAAATPVPAVLHAPDDKMPFQEAGMAEAVAPPQARAATFSVNVVVYSQEGAPLDIQARINRLDGAMPPMVYPPQPGSFRWQLTLAKGAYMLAIDGTNTEGGSASVTIDGDFAREPVRRQATSSDPSYLLNFVFEIA